MGTARTFSPGERLLREGESSTHVALLIHGITKVISILNDGHEILLAVRVGGDLIGELAALDGGPRSAGVVAITSVLARQISAQAFHQYLEIHPAVAVTVGRTVGDRLRSATRHRVAYLNLKPRARICRVLAEIVDKHGRPMAVGWDLGVAIRQEDIASLAGMRLRAAQTHFAALRDDGVLDLGYQHITVLDLDRLRRESDGAA